MKHADLTEKIIGIYFEVYNELGHGFLESVYEQAMVVALRQLGLQVEQQVSVPVWFRGQQIGSFYADLLVENVVIVELKAAQRLDPSAEAQRIHYLKATEIDVGLLFNFGVQTEFKRRIFDNPRKALRAHPC